MASPPEEDVVRRRLGSRLFRQKSDGRRPTMELPDRFKNLRVDADEDVRPPNQGPSMLLNMNHSIFGLIAAAGSTVDFNDRFEGQSSDEDDDNDDSNGADTKEKGKGKGKGKQREQVAKTTILNEASFGRGKDTTDEKPRRRIPSHLLQSLPQLPHLAKRPMSKRSTPPKPSQPSQPSQPSDKSDHDSETSTSPSTRPQSPTAEVITTGLEERRAPVMSRMLDARAEMSSRPSFDLEGVSRDQPNEGDETGPGALARKLKEIFEFDHLEEVIEGMIQRHPRLRHC